MTSIWLVRHGEAAAAWNEHEDPGLSSLGLQQAQATAEVLAPVLPADLQILSSPKARALETAAPLAEILECPVAVVDTFREIQAPVGLDQRREWLTGFMRQEWHQQPETLWEWRNNIVDALRQIDRPTVVFTHFLVINAVVAHIRDEQATVQLWPDNASYHQFLNAESGLEMVAMGREMVTRIN